MNDQITITPEAAAVRPQRGLEFTDFKLENLPGFNLVNRADGARMDAGEIVATLNALQELLLTTQQAAIRLALERAELLAACVEAEAAFRQASGVNVSREWRALDGLRVAIERASKS